MSKSSLITASLLLLAATLSWGGMFPVAKPALALMDPYYMTLYRYLPAAVAFLLIVILVEGLGVLRLEGHFVNLMALSTLGFAGFNLLCYTALGHTRPEHGAVILALMPMITALLHWQLKGIKPPAFTLNTVVAAFMGVFLVITGGHPVRAFADGSAPWDLMFIGGALCWVGYTMGAQLVPHWSSLRYTAITCALGSLALAVITLILTLMGHLHAPTLATTISLKWTLAYLIGPGALVAVLSWNIGIRMMGALNGILFMNFVPITAYIIGVVQGHPLGTVEVFGALLVIGGLIANNLYLRRSLKQAAINTTA